MLRPMAQVRAWLELTRLSNLATVWTNLLVGLYAGAIAAAQQIGHDPPLDGVAWLGAMLSGGLPLFIAGTVFYAGGMILNDVVDARFDAETRPQRPLPSGRVDVPTAVGATGGLFGIGITALAVVGILDERPWAAGFGGLLLVAIVAYDLLHRRTAQSIWLMAACRALLVLMGAGFAPLAGTPHWWSVAGPFAGLIFVYTATLTWVARKETGPEPGARRWAGWAMPFIVLSAAALAPEHFASLASLLTAVLLAVWLSGAAAVLTLSRPVNVKAAVMMWLCGFCLADAFYLMLLGQPVPAAVAGLGFVATAFAHRRITGT